MQTFSYYKRMFKVESYVPPQEGCDPLFEKCWLKHTAKICMEEVFRFKMMSCRIVIAIAPTLNKLFM